MSPLADLHLHTHHSDGRLAPVEVVQLAQERGLRVIAVTDHDTVEGVAEAAASGKEAGIEIIPGVELSVTVDGEEIHLLGYFFDPAHSDLRQHLKAFQLDRQARAAAIVERLATLGAAISLESVLQKADGGAVGRPHIAAALVDAGHVATQHEAFQRYLTPGTPAFVARTPYSAREAIALLHEAGGIAALAHPGQWTSTATLKALVDAGMDGVETVHPSHSSWLTEYYRQLAERYGLLETGGSDFHGWRPQDNGNIGRYAIPLSQLESIRKHAA